MVEDMPIFFLRKETEPDKKKNKPTICKEYQYIEGPFEDLIYFYEM